MAIVGVLVLGVGSLDRRRNQNYRKATLKPDSCTDPILKCASEGGRRRAVIQMSDTNTERTEHCFSVSDSAWFGCAAPR